MDLNAKIALEVDDGRVLLSVDGGALRNTA